MKKTFALALLMVSSASLPASAQTRPYGDETYEHVHDNGYRDEDDASPPVYWDEAPDEPQSRGERLFQAQMLKDHNDARRAVGQSPLRWNAQLAADAARYARTLARTRIFQHSKGQRGATPQGENLWMGSIGRFSYREMVGSWVDERRWFRRAAMPRVSTTGRWADVGHYTQIVWHSTTDVGCAMADNGRDEYLVCRYSPPGNVYGRDPLGGDEPPPPKPTGW